MAGNTEEALAGVQTEATNAEVFQKHHKSTLVYISERIFRYLFGIFYIGLVISWLNVPEYITY